MSDTHQETGCFQLLAQAVSDLGIVTILFLLRAHAETRKKLQREVNPEGSTPALDLVIATLTATELSKNLHRATRPQREPRVTRSWSDSRTQKKDSQNQMLTRSGRSLKLCSRSHPAIEVAIASGIILQDSYHSP